MFFMLLLMCKQCGLTLCVRVLDIWLCCCVGGMPLSPTAASTTVGSPIPYSFSCSVAASAAVSTDDVISVFDLNKPANDQQYDDSTVPPLHSSHPSLLSRSPVTFLFCSSLKYMTYSARLLSVKGIV